MHFQDYCLLLFLAGWFVFLASMWALSKRLSWWKDGLQIAALIVAVAMISGFFAPKKPKSPEQIAGETNDILEQQRHRAIIDAMTACDNAIQSNLAYPGSYSSTIFSSANRQFETDQGWEIYKAFEAKNGFGGSLPHVGHCSVTRSRSITVEISRS